MKFSMKFVSKGPVNSIPALGRLSADKATNLYLNHLWLD